MKFTAKIVEVTERIIEVEARDYADAKDKLNGAREEAGAELQSEQTIQWYCELADVRHRDYPTIRWI